MAQIWRCCSCGVGQQLQLQLDPWPGNLQTYAAGAALKKKKKKRTTLLATWKYTVASVFKLVSFILLVGFLRTVRETGFKENGQGAVASLHSMWKVTVTKTGVVAVGWNKKWTGVYESSFRVNVRD